MIVYQERWVQRLLMDPLNSWNWYEASKHGMTLEDALEMARDRNIPEQIVREGYRENE